MCPGATLLGRRVQANCRMMHCAKTNAFWPGPAEVRSRVVLQRRPVAGSDSNRQRILGRHLDTRGGDCWRRARPNSRRRANPSPEIEQLYRNHRRGEFRGYDSRHHARPRRKRCQPRRHCAGARSRAPVTSWKYYHLLTPQFVHWPEMSFGIKCLCAIAAKSSPNHQKRQQMSTGSNPGRAGTVPAYQVEGRALRL
jgi:hypothetical protein